MNDGAPAWRGGFAAHLLDEYWRLADLPKTRQTCRAETALKYEALDMLEEMGAPESVLALFDALLGGVVAEWEATAADRRWVGPAVAYEAEALAAGRDVTDAELVEKIFLPAMAPGFDRDEALDEVRATRDAGFYRAFVLTRLHALGNSDET